jgi:WD40 repeat protein
MKVRLIVAVLRIGDEGHFTGPGFPMQSKSAGVTVSRPSQSYSMRTRLFFLGAFLVSCTSAPTASRLPSPAVPSLSREYTGVYISTPDEEYFTPCGIDVGGDSWSLRFRESEPQAPFLKKVTAVRGYLPLTHFIRIRGRLGPLGSYNRGFEKRQLAVDSVLDVKESLEPCRGFGTPAGWNGFRERFRDSRGTALSNDGRLVALLDNERQLTIWSTTTGERVSNFAASDKGKVQSGGAQLVFSDDGEMLAVGGIDGMVRVWRPRDGKRIFAVALKDSAVVASEMAKIVPRPDSPGYRHPVPPSNSYTPARQIVFDKRGTMLATTNLFSTIVWSMKTGKKLAEFKVGDDIRRKVFFVGDEGLLMTIDSGSTSLRPSLAAQREQPSGMPTAESDRVVMTPDRRTIVVGTWGDSVFLWSVPEGPTRVLHIPGLKSGATAFSPDGKTIAIAGGMYGLYLYDMRTGAPIRAFHNFPNELSGAWFTPDGKAIVTLSAFDDRFRIVYVDPSARLEGQPIFDDSLTAKLPPGPPPSTSPRTVGGTVTGPNQRAVAEAEVAISNGEAPDSVIARATTSPGGYFSFNGIRFRHVVIRVRKPGFAPAVKYIHLDRYNNDGPWGIELKPETRPAESGVDKSG